MEKNNIYKKLNSNYRIECIYVYLKMLNQTIN